jgi:hypothetical protein
MQRQQLQLSGELALRERQLERRVVQTVFNLNRRNTIELGTIVQLPVQ